MTSNATDGDVIEVFAMRRYPYVQSECYNGITAGIYKWNINYRYFKQSYIVRLDIF